MAHLKKVLQHSPLQSKANLRVRRFTTPTSTPTYIDMTTSVKISSGSSLKDSAITVQTRPVATV